MAITTDVVDLTALHDRLAGKVTELASNLKVPGVAVGIFSQGDEDFLFHGVTSIENPLEVNSDTLFQIGSTSKTYTATALMILAERGKVKLEEPVRKYLPDFRVKDEEVSAKVRVLDLLNHTAGWLGDIFEDTGNGDDALQVYVDKLAKIPQMAPLGTVASYNNAAFNVAGLIVETIMGKPFEVALKELVLEPLGLESTFFYDGTIITRRVAIGHTEEEEVVKVARTWPIPRSANPAGGIISNAADQLKYARFHLGDGTAADGTRVLSAESMARMKQPTFTLHGSLGDEVGISWLCRTVDGVRQVGHGGATNGQMAAFQMVPERDFAVAVLTNAGAGGLLHRDLVEWIEEEYLGVRAPKDEPLELAADALEPFTGTYDAGLATLSISIDGETLVLLQTPTEEGIRQERSFTGQDPAKPKPMNTRVIANDRLMVVDGPAKGAKVSVLRTESGEVRALLLGGRAAYRVR